MEIVGNVDRDEGRHFPERFRNRQHLRAIVYFQVGEGNQSSERVRQGGQFTVGDIKLLELGQSADFVRKGPEPVAKLAVHHVHRADEHPSRAFLDYFIFLHGSVKVNLRNMYVVLQKGTCHRFRELCGRVDETEIFLVPFHPVASARSRLDGRVVFEQIIVVVGAEIKLHELAQLADGRGEVAPKSEIADVDQGYPAVGMELDSRLVSPEVRVLVEIPVGPCRPVLSAVIPVASVEGLPYFLEGEIVLQIFV